MNQEQRKKIGKIVGILEDQRDDMTEMREEEQEKFDNLTEGLQQTENGEAMEIAITQLENGADDLDGVITTIEALI